MLYSSPTNASDTKNSPIHSGNFLVSWFAVLLTSILLVPFFGFMAKKWPSSRLKQFRVTVWVPIRGDLKVLKAMQRVRMRKARPGVRMFSFEDRATQG